MSTISLGLLLLSFFPWSEAAAVKGFDIPLTAGQARISKRGGASGSIGLGDAADAVYSVSINIGSNVIPVQVDTGSSDLWVITDQCQAGVCASPTPGGRLAANSLQLSKSRATITYGDGTSSTGPVAYDTVGIAGVTIPKQPFIAVDSTSAAGSVGPVASGLIGLSFPLYGAVQQSLMKDAGQFPFQTSDIYLQQTSTVGPMLSRLALMNTLESPMFSLSLPRGSIEADGGHGSLTIGKLPDGVDTGSLTWSPVRLYTPAEGGLAAPTFAPNEVYPNRWEIDIEGVFLDGQRLPDSTIPANGGVDSKRVSALIDSGTSAIRGPADVVQNILTLLGASSDGTFPCDNKHHLAFQIGGKMFPIDPRDLIHIGTGDTTTCLVPVLPASPPDVTSLARWILGAPFFKSNLIGFYYGNLTTPSVDPPRIGVLSTVPATADDDLQKVLQDARNNGSGFDQTTQTAPTNFQFFPTGSASSPVGKVPLPSQTSKPNASKSNDARRTRMSYISVQNIIITLAAGFSCILLL